MTNTHELVGFVLSLGEGVASLSDGASFTDVFKFVEAVKRAPAAFKDAAACVEEVKNATDEQKAKLKAYIAADFDIENDQVETAIETCLSIAVDLSDLLKLLPAKA